MLFLLTSCEDAPKEVEVKSLTNTWDNFDLIADKNTGIIYYYFDSNEADTLCPYYSENGKLCRFEDGEIVEIGD